MTINRSDILQEITKPNNNNKKMFTPPKNTKIPINRYKMWKPKNKATQDFLKLLQKNN